MENPIDLVGILGADDAFTILVYTRDRHTLETSFKVDRHGPVRAVLQAAHGRIALVNGNGWDGFASSSVDCCFGAECKKNLQAGLVAWGHYAGKHCIKRVFARLAGGYFIAQDTELLKSIG